MNKRIKSITVVGGGTAGSFASANIKKHFPWLEVNLVYSDKIDTIGVGESVTPPIKHFMDDLGADEKQWMKDTGSIYKYANCFEDWCGENDKQYFAFTYNEPVDMVLDNKTITFDDIRRVRNTDTRLTDIWLNLFKNKKFNNYSESFNPMHPYMEMLKAPFAEDEYLGSPNFSYAFHVDAEKLGPWVRDNIGKKLGVNEIVGTITNIEKDENGISKLILGNGMEIVSDIYVDATGFHRLLIKEFDETYHHYEHCPANSAWVGPIAYTNKAEQMKNYTQSIRQEEGWLFKIGLHDRMGMGLVYSDKYFNDDAALLKFEELQDGKALKEPRLIKWESKRLEQPAQKNVVSIGMAAGFVEPMEANALFVTVATIWQLNFALRNNAIDWKEYNRNTGHALDDIADFISVHYTLCPKQTNQFWKDMHKVGKRLRHSELLLKKYYGAENTTACSTQFLTIFPDYMWAELASTWTHMDYRWFKNIDETICEKFYNHLMARNLKHKQLARQCEDYADWIGNNR